MDITAKHGLLWWQIDVSYGVIKLLNWFGLTKNIRTVSKAIIETHILKTLCRATSDFYATWPAAHPDDQAH